MEDFSRSREIYKRKQHKDTKTRFEKQMKKLIITCNDIFAKEDIQDGIHRLRKFIEINKLNYFKLKLIEKRYFIHAFNWYVIKNNKVHYGTEAYKINFNEYCKDIKNRLNNSFLFIKYIEFIRQKEENMK